MIQLSVLVERGYESGMDIKNGIICHWLRLVVDELLTGIQVIVDALQ